MTSKILKIFLPTTIAFIAFVGLLKLEDIFHNQLFPTNQDIDNGAAESLSNFLLVIALILPYIFCLLAQKLIVIPFWTKIKIRKTSFGLRLWQILTLSIIFVFVITFLYGLLADYTIKLLLVDCIVFTLMFAVYWTINFLTLEMIDTTKNN